MLNARQNKVLWIPRVILLINFLFFLIYGALYCGEIVAIEISVVQFILLISFFVLTFRKAIVSGILFILMSPFD